MCTSHCCVVSLSPYLKAWRHLWTTPLLLNSTELLVSLSFHVFCALPLQIMTCYTDRRDRHTFLSNVRPITIAFENVSDKMFEAKTEWHPVFSAHHCCSSVRPLSLKMDILGWGLRARHSVGCAQLREEHSTEESNPAE